MPERPVGNLQYVRSTGLHAVRLSQSCQQQRALDVGYVLLHVHAFREHRAWSSLSLVRSLRHQRPQPVLWIFNRKIDAKFLSGLQSNGPFDGIFQLPDVARPVVTA